MQAKTVLHKCIIGAFWLLLWQIAAMIVDSKLLLPGPVDTVRALGGLVVQGSFYHDILATVWRCAAAIVLALAFGLVLALVSYRWRVVREVLSLPVAFFKAVPIMAVAIYMLFLLAAGNVPILVCFIMCFPIVYTNLLAGLDSMDPQYLELAKIYRLPGSRILRHIYWPQMFPYFRSALSLIAGMSWKAVVTAEVLSVPKFSLGYELMNAKYYLETERLFAYVITIVVISVLFERLIRAILQRQEVRPYEGSRIRGSKQETHADNAAPAVYIRDLSKVFGTKTVLKDFSLDIPAGEVTALMAPSGWGKTTLVRILTGLETADSGSVQTEPESSGMSILFQEDRLLPWLTIYDNLALVQQCPDPDRIRSLLDAVGLASEQSKLPGQLSGGMNHRAALARTFLNGAELLIFDEPFRGLDETTRESVIDRLWRPESTGKTVLLITHDPDIAELLADRVVTAGDA